MRFTFHACCFLRNKNYFTGHSSCFEENRMSVYFYVAVQTHFSCKPNITQSYFIALMDTKNNIYHQKLILV